MASGLIALERRCAPRLQPEYTPWRELAILRPGQDVHVVNLSSGGALVESGSRMAPGTRTELQLFGVPKRSLRGRIDRCQVTRLEPVCYQGAIVFDEWLEIGAPVAPG